MMKKSTQLFLPIVALMVLSACSSTGESNKKIAFNTQGQPVLHAVDSSELRIVMRRMKGLMFERNLTDQELDTQRRRAFGEVLEAANGIEQAITQILSVKPRLNLGDSNMQVFEKMAQHLKDEAGNLKIQAQNQQTEEIQTTLQNINGTCNACHSLFRDFSKKGE